MNGVAREVLLFHLTKYLLSCIGVLGNVPDTVKGEMSKIHSLQTKMGY